MATKFSKKSFPQTLARNQILVPHLEAYDQWDQPWEFKYEPKEKDDAWHPSGDCTPSTLDLYRKATQRVDAWLISPSLQRTFLVGHFWHQVIQKVVVELGFARPEDIERVGIRGWGPTSVSTVRDIPGLDYTDGRIPWGPYRWVRGQADICPLVCGDWSGLVDIKTMNTSDFAESERGGLLPLRFADKYECQINIYMDLFDQDEALILGVNKDSSRFIEFRFQRNQALIDSIFAKWQYVGDCIQSGVEPTEEFDLIYKGPVN